MEIVFYEDLRGRRPVQEFIDQLSQRTELNQIAVYMRVLQEQGYRLQRPFAAPLGRGIYELRPGPHRILYGFYKGTLVLLHALRKKTSRVPDHDIRLARKRLEEWSGYEEKS